MSEVIIPVKNLKDARKLSKLLDGIYLSTKSKKGIQFIKSSPDDQYLRDSRLLSGISHLVIAPYDDDLSNIEIQDKVIMLSSNAWEATSHNSSNPLGSLGTVINVASNGSYKVRWNTGIVNDSYLDRRDLIKVE